MRGPSLSRFQRWLGGAFSFNAPHSFFITATSLIRAAMTISTQDFQLLLLPAFFLCLKKTAPHYFKLRTAFSLLFLSVQEFFFFLSPLPSEDPSLARFDAAVRRMALSFLNPKARFRGLVKSTDYSCLTPRPPRSW